MNKPTIDELMKQVNSKYALVVLAAKRARTLSPEQLTTPEGRMLKAVSVALQEIAESKIRYELSRGGLK
ncbi:MAG: DNA-directed RNA polymerase subunit omega [Clostridia bacterium]|jgi:DNA-directed RNA polymerase subunit omega|nr:DNA-directed RNA polymerase subunit omega [Clostridia bacterium]MDH7572140.1 DNA-directed RNA polymerase subunit omega [Clostridia bacterium]